MSRLQSALADSASAALPVGGATCASQLGVSFEESLMRPARQFGYPTGSRSSNNEGLVFGNCGELGRRAILTKRVRQSLKSSAPLPSAPRKKRQQPRQQQKREAKAAARKAKAQTLMGQVLKLGDLPRENGKESHN